MNDPKTSEALAEERLRKAILNGQLPTDQFLSQRVLAERVGAAVVTVRAALRTLESDGLIENVPRWGVRIPGETEATIRDRYHIREILELEAVRKLAENPRPRQADMLRRLAERCDYLAIHYPDDMETYSQAHWDLHHTIAECSESPLLVETLDRVFYKTMLRFNTRREWLRGSLGILHVPVIEDVLCGDVERALRVMKAHIGDGLKFELEALQDQREVAL